MTNRPSPPREDAVNEDDLIIPIIDFSRFLDGSQEDKIKCAKSLLMGFQTAGFVYLKGHGIPIDLVDEAFAFSARFFNRPMEQKEQLRWVVAESNRGYMGPGREKVSNIKDKKVVDEQRKLFSDLKETLEIGKDDDPVWKNHWPDQFDEEGVRFRKFMNDFFAICQELNRAVMSSIALAFDLPEDFFANYCSDANNNLRLLHYPPVKKSVFRENPHQLRCGTHSDFGSITLLFQDDCGGLQVKSPRGTFIDAKPIKGCVVVNAGDLLARWSNDTIKSTQHRVVEPRRSEEIENDGNDHYPARYSIAYFCNPNNEAVIEVLPVTYGEGRGEKKYKDSIRTQDHLVERLRATLAEAY